MRREPALLIAVALIVVVFGIDLAALSATVERIVEVIAILSGGALVRRNVWSQDSHAAELQLQRQLLTQD